MSDSKEKLVEHLLKKALLLKNVSSTAHRISQSRLTTQGLEIASQCDLKMNVSKNSNLFKLCQWCFCYWTEGMYTFKVEPQKRPSKSIRSLLKRNVESLNKMQLKLRKRYTERRNRLVVKCNICNRRTRVYLEKPEFQTRENSSGQNQHQVKMKKKRKKKKKDSFAGLKSEAIVKSKNSNLNQQLPHDVKPLNHSTNRSQNDKKYSRNENSTNHIQSKISKKKKKFNVDKLKNIFAQEKKIDAQNIKKSHNSLLSSFLTSL